MCFHQPCVAVHVWESTCMAHWRSVLYAILSRFYYVRVDSRSILVTRKILQSMSWWMFYVGIPYNTWRLGTWIFEPSLVLSGDKIRWRQTVVAYSSDWLSVSGAILAGICFPPIPWPMITLQISSAHTNQGTMDGGSMLVVTLASWASVAVFDCLGWWS